MAVRQVDDDADDYRKRAAASRKDKMSKGLFKLPEGDTIVRILKTPKDTERNSPSVFMEYYIHRNIGPKRMTLRCGKDVHSELGNCWLCKMVEQKKAEGKTQMAAAMERKRTYAVQVAVWDDDIGGLRGPLLWPMSSGKSAKSLSYRVETIISNKKDFIAHKGGFNFTFNRIGTGMLDTAYGDTERAEEPSDVPKQILAKLKPFADVVLQYSKVAQKAAYYNRPLDQEEGEETSMKRSHDEDEEEVVPKKKKPIVEVDDDDEDEAPPKKKRPVVVDDDEDEEEAPPKKKKVIVDVEDEEEEDAPPKKKKRPVVVDEDEDEAPPKKKRVVVDDDEEEAPPKKKKPIVEVDDDDEDEAPPKKKRVVVDDDEDEDEAPPKKKRPVVEVDDDDEDEAPPKKKRPVVVDDDDDLDFGDEAPPKKKRPVADDEDEDEAPPKKKKRPVPDEDDE